MRVATWNVNSLRVRLPQLLEWLQARQPDVVCLQETKVEDPSFPVEELRASGYEAAFAGQKTYNGVAILSRGPPAEVASAMPDFPDEQKRLIAGTVDATRVVCVYVPNGESTESEKYRYKLRWLAAFRAWIAQELARHPRLVVLGDYNIAPDERDVHDPALWEGKVLFSDPERAALRALLDTGLEDSFRLFDQPEKSFTWWDYRMNAFRRNLGLRIDHILLSRPLASACTAAFIDREVRNQERPSDHAPVVVDLAG